MSQFSSHDPYQMGKETYTDGLLFGYPAGLTPENREKFCRGWAARENIIQNSDKNLLLHVYERLGDL